MRFLSVKTILFVGLLGISAPTWAKDFNVEVFTLENGMEVILLENHRAPVVTHMMWYKFGGGDEKRGISGTAHFLEHLMFKGTPTVPDGQFSATVKMLGGNDNAFTSHDYTAYYQNIAKQHLPRMMEMEADRMKNLVLKEDEVDSERQVIIEERRQRIDNEPQARLQEQMMSALFVNHAYSTPVIGWLHEIQHLTREDALDSYNTWYTPNNAVLVISGDITMRELKPMAEKYYGALVPSALPNQERPEPAPITLRHRLIMEDERIGLRTVIKTYRAPRGNDGLELLTEILGGSSSSRLYTELVVKKKLAVSAGADYDPISLNDTTLSFYATPAPGISLPQLESALDAEIKKILDHGVTEQELKAAQSKKTAEWVYYRDSLQGPAILFGRAITSGFDTDYLEDWSARIDKLSVEDISAAANTMFNEEQYPVTGLLLPKEKKQATQTGEKE